MIPKVLTIAGSDPSGGAGIQADLKTFSALGCYGMSAITALTAQNTQGVYDVHEVPAEFVQAQIKAVFEDIDVAAVKIGMVGSVETIQVIAEAIQKFKPLHIVFDPVMVATSGDALISDDAIESLKTELIPLASVITPNIPEAEILSGQSGDMEDMAKALLDLGALAVLLKGGHLGGDTSSDVLATKEEVIELPQVRIMTDNTHGTGCTLSSALSAFLAKEENLADATRNAKAYVTGALRHADELDIGKGSGPVHHFYKMWT